MRTTIDIPDHIMSRLKVHIEKNGLTIKEVISQAISLYFSNNLETKKVKFNLSDHSVGGTGLTKEFQDKSWETIREAIYSDISSNNKKSE